MRLSPESPKVLISETSNAKNKLRKTRPEKVILMKFTAFGDEAGIRGRVV